jgi:hypothetical protein
MDLNETECEGVDWYWMRLLPDRDQWSVVYTVMNIRVP